MALFAKAMLMVLMAAGDCGALVVALMAVGVAKMDGALAVALMAVGVAKKALH